MGLCEQVSRLGSKKAEEWIAKGSEKSEKYSFLEEEVQSMSQHVQIVLIELYWQIVGHE